MFLGFVIFAIYQPVVDKLQLVYLEHRQIRKSSAAEQSQHFNSTCNSNADRRGHRQKVVAYSIYGNFSKEEVARRYLNPLKEIVNKIPQAFPGTKNRIFHLTRLMR